MKEISFIKEYCRKIIPIQSMCRGVKKKIEAACAFDPGRNVKHEVGRRWLKTTRHYVHGITVVVRVHLKDYPFTGINWML